MARDISAQGAIVRFEGGLNITISEFSDEGTPFECQDVDLSTNAKNLNGEMISSRTPAVYTFSVTVIPGTVADHVLSMWFMKQLLQPGQNHENDVDKDWYCNATVYVPGTFTENSYESDGGNVYGSRQITFTNCRAKSGPIGPSTSAEGRLSARTYTFEAEGMTV